LLLIKEPAQRVGAIIEEILPSAHELHQERLRAQRGVPEIRSYPGERHHALAALEFAEDILRLLRHAPARIRILERPNGTRIHDRHVVDDAETLIAQDLWPSSIEAKTPSCGGERKGGRSSSSAARRKQGIMISMNPTRLAKKFALRIAAKWA
jgi:hypothetical protein